LDGNLGATRKYLKKQSVAGKATAEFSTIGEHWDKLSVNSRLNLKSQ
jgi:hypothetical protein